MGKTQITTLVAGVVMAAYGAWLLLGLGWANTRATLPWLIGGVVLHDGVFAVLTLGLSVLALRLFRPNRLAPWVVGLVIVVPTTLLAIPELGRYGARTDNTTLLDRHYWLGWFALIAVVVAGILVAQAGSAWHAKRSRRVSADAGGDDGQDPGGR